MVRTITREPGVLFVIACIYYLTIKLLPVINYWSSVYIDILMILIIACSIFINNGKKILKFFPPFMLIVFIQLINGLLKAVDFRTIVISFYDALNFIIPIIISFYLISNSYRKTIKILLIYSIVFMTITSITTIYGLITYPEASKDMATGMHGDTQLMVYYSKNIAGFDFIYMIPIVLPLFFPIYKKHKVNWMLLSIALIPMIYSVYVSQYAIALVSVMISLSSIIFHRFISPKFFLTFAVFTILSLVIFKTYVADLFYFLAVNVNSYELTHRFNALGNSIMGLDVIEDVFVYRLYAYMTSISTFLANPIVGGLVSNSVKVGGHSFILDILASYGTFGIFALFFAYRKIMQVFYIPFKSLFHYKFMLWSFFLSILLSIFNTSANFFAIGLFVPFVACISQCENYFTKLEVDNCVKI